MTAKLWIVNLIVALIIVSAFADSQPKRRAKRYLSFLEKGVVFVRLNSKHNMVMETRVYAQGTGFRVNFPLPVGRIKKRRKIHRRDVYQNLEELIMHHGYDGRACILRSLCEASKVVTPQSNILMKLFKKVFTIPEGDDQYFPYLASEKCEELDMHCPISLLQLSKYTDI